MSKYQAYPEYKDSGVEWLGDTPVHWKAKQLKFLCTYNDEALPDSTSKDYELEYVDIGSVSATEGISKTETMLFEKAPSRARRVVRDGDVIISTVRTYLEAIAAIDNPPENLIVSTGFAVIRPNQYLHKGYAAYCLRANGFIKEVVARSVGVSYPAINASDLVDIKVPEPAYEEQEKIAHFLDHETAKIDTLIDKQQQLIQLLKEKRQAVISHAVTKGLPSTTGSNAPMRDSGVEWLGEVPEHWDIKKLKYLVNESLMYGANEAALDVNFENPRFVRITDVKDDGSLKDDTFRSLNEELAKPYLLKDGDILLARTGGTVGKSFMYSESWGRCCFAGYLIKASLNQSVLKAEWFYRYTQTQYYWEWIASSQIQATLPNVSADKYNGFLIAVPSIKEQIEILNNLQTDIKRFDEIISKAELVIQLMKERRTALISAAVTGKIDVRQHVSRPASSL